MNTNKSDLEIQPLQFKKAALILRAINHPLRQQMLRLTHQQGRITVTELYSKLRLEQSVASQHLAILRRAGYVLTERQGKFVFYTVNYQRLKEVQQLVGEII
jgi:DNA-binding transcriptional ArsR family regulator